VSDARGEEPISGHQEVHRTRHPFFGRREGETWFDLWFRADDSTARNFFLSAGLWLVFGTTLGVLLAIEFVFPDAISWPPLVFSRLRQEHVNAVMFGFLSTGMFGIWYFLTPRLTGRRIWSELLGNILFVGWNAAVLVGVIGIALAHSQSREYAEMVWGVDVAVLVMLVLHAVNIFVTVAKRLEKKLYVALWFILGSAIWMPALYAIGNVVWQPPEGALIGINDAVWGWFYGHNVLGLWFTTGFLGIFYYVLPKEVNTPLWSIKLGLLSFWGTVLFYTGVGGHHILWAPVPDWLKTTAVAESIGMLLPVTAFLINFYMTMRGNWNRLWTSIPLRFTALGAIAYVVVSFQGTHMALPGFNSLEHFTQYVPAHSHLGLLFFSGSFVLGAMFYAIPRLFDCQLYSRFLASWQWVFYAVGFTFFFLGFVIAGLVQGSDWVRIGMPVWSVLPAIRPWMALRIFGGVLMYVSFWLFLINMLGTYLVQQPRGRPETPVQPAQATGTVGEEAPVHP
jgi:cbb3-type cytochrome c oxidase subunit I